MKYHRTWNDSLSLNHTQWSIFTQQKQPCPLTPTQIISVIFPSNTKQQLNILKSFHKLKNWEVRSKAGLKVQISDRHQTTQSSLAANLSRQGNQGAETNGMFRENNPRKLRIQGLWGGKGGLMPPEVLQRLDLSLSHSSTRTDKRKWAPLDSVLTPARKPSLHQTKSLAPATWSFMFLPMSNLLSEFEEPKSWEYLQDTSMGTPWLEGSDSRVEVRVNSENSHLSSSPPAPPSLLQLLHQDR